MRPLLSIKDLEKAGMSAVGYQQRVRNLDANRSLRITFEQRANTTRPGGRATYLINAMNFL